MRFLCCITNYLLNFQKWFVMLQKELVGKEVTKPRNKDTLNTTQLSTLLFGSATELERTLNVRG